DVHGRELARLDDHDLLGLYGVERGHQVVGGYRVRANGQQSQGLARRDRAAVVTARSGDDDVGGHAGRHAGDLHAQLAHDGVDELRADLVSGSHVDGGRTLDEVVLDSADRQLVG